ncbi:hypothetical protein FF38_06451 [Lucilia cuprina]|uniref:Uncharacterized protein n=1 Tax=Lucilia cuprina TaxID=7375 RepID=A0A0L0CP26_LUCCU|nr:hypothetical protein CVS40_4542 [Lucilia cuprina]KNC34085.1 hypothetical protein FF38_06451 [Lucilia cuprina]
MHLQIFHIYLLCLIFMIFQTSQASEFSAEVEEPTLSAEDSSLEDRLLAPQIKNDMLSHKNPVITNNELKELWEKLPEYELTDIK